MVTFIGKATYTIEDLRQLVAFLRSENGCPWDKVQTHESIRRNFLEEAYEVSEAIERDDPALLREELGDVLLQVMFHAQIKAEEGVFTLDHVADAVCKKLVSRHPHLFADQTALDSDQVMENWEAIKRREKAQETVSKSLQDVATSLPATWRAEKVGNKAARAGFDFPDVAAALDKLAEETEELKSALEMDKPKREEELGDLLFSIVNVARKLDIDPEDALNGATDKFIRRFGKVENGLVAQGVSIEDATLQQMDALWEKHKQEN